MNAPDIVSMSDLLLPLELKLRSNHGAQCQFFNRAHSVGTLLKWRGERTSGEGFMKSPAYLERGILPVVPIFGHLVPIPLSWILSHDDDSESESDG